MGIFGNLFGIDNKPLLINAIKKAMNIEQNCIDLFVNELKHSGLEEKDKKPNTFELFEILQKIKNQHFKLIEVKGASSREIYQVLLELKAKNVDYDGKTDTATGKIGNFEISLIRTTNYGGIFVQVIASVDGFEVIDIFLKSLKSKATEIKPTINEYKEKHSSSREVTINSNILSTEDEIYERIMIEIEENNKVKSTWAKALAQSDGDKDKAESLYINMRFEDIQNSKIIDKTANLSSFCGSCGERLEKNSIFCGNCGTKII